VLNELHQQYMANASLSDEERRALITTTPRQSGKSFAPAQQQPSSTRPDRHLDLHQLDIMLQRGRDHRDCVVVWTSNLKFTYAAIYANHKWFITGTGKFYGGNEFSHEDFVYKVLGDAEVTSLFISTKFKHIFERW
jgi:hypothetical protein